MQRNISYFAAPLFAVFLILHATSVGNCADKGKVTLNFQKTDIKAVIQAIGKMTGVTFLLDPRVKGTVDIVSASPVSTDIVYEILITTLRLHGFTAIESDGVTKIVPEALAKHHGSPVVKNQTSLRRAPIDGQNVKPDPSSAVYAEAEDIGVFGDRIITQVYPLTHVSVEEMQAAIKPLVGPTDGTMAFQSSNTLLITGYASNIKRLNDIVASLDVPDRGEVEIMNLEHISPVDFIDIFEKLYLNKGGGSQIPQSKPTILGKVGRFSVIPDMRTNSIIVKSNNQHMNMRIRELIAKVDTPTAHDSNIRLVNIKHADVKKIAETLNKLLPKNKKADGSAPIGVHAHEESKSLIISAPEDIYKSLRAVISKLDVRRKLVFVEALVAEITSDKVATFGIQWQSLSGVEANRAPGLTGVGGVNFGSTRSEIGNAGASLAGKTPPSGFTIGLINGAITLADGTIIPNLMALANALKTDTDANILSTPTLLTLDNEEVKIIVGQNVPLLTGSSASSTGGTSSTVTPFQTIERKDIGLKLTIKPTISDTGSIKLAIFEEVSSLLPFAGQTGTVDVVVNKRSLESTVIVNDGQMIVLGGLIQGNISLNEERVPFLGSIPIIGNFFRHETRQHRKTNLIVFIRPYIIKDPADSDSITAKAYNYTVGEQGEVKAGSHLLLPNVPTPSLPDLELYDRGDNESIPEIPSPKESATAPQPSKKQTPTKDWFGWLEGNDNANSDTRYWDF